MEAANPPPVAEKKPLFDTVVISTPVLLTVIATFILGRSSSEMTQAQYQRAVAGQNQSQVANQWAFFQAKRVRGTTYEVASVALLAHKADQFTADTLVDSAQSLIREIALTQKDADKLREPLQALDKKAEAALEQIKSALNPPTNDSAGKPNARTPEAVKAALEALESYPKAKQEKSADDEIDPEQRRILEEILKDVRAFRPEKEVTPKTLALKTDTVEIAMERAKTNAARTAERGKAIDRVLEEFDALVDRQAALGREYQRLLSGHIAALAKANAEASDIQKLEARLDRVRTLSAKMLTDYKAARYAFDARRYEDDARSNQEAAYLYDVQVYQSSARSDKHLKRSFGFMIAMLVAQVGVTIGSLALALRRRIPAWALAAIAGVSAIVFGVLVFLEMAPLF